MQVSCFADLATTLKKTFKGFLPPLAGLLQRGQPSSSFLEKISRRQTLLAQVAGTSASDKFISASEGKVGGFMRTQSNGVVSALSLLSEDAFGDAASSAASAASDRAAADIELNIAKFVLTLSLNGFS